MPKVDLPDLLEGSDRAAWERLPGETDRDYKRFQLYLYDREMTIAEASRQLELHYQTVLRIAQKWRWRSRRELYWVEETIETRRQMRDNLRRHTESLTDAWRMCLEWALESAAQHMAEGKHLSPRDVSRMLKDTTDALRILDGQPGSQVVHTFEGVSNEKLKALEDMIKDLDPDE